MAARSLMPAFVSGGLFACAAVAGAIAPGTAAACSGVYCTRAEIFAPASDATPYFAFTPGRPPGFASSPPIGIYQVQLFHADGGAEIGYDAGAADPEVKSSLFVPAEPLVPGESYELRYIEPCSPGAGLPDGGPQTVSRTFTIAHAAVPPTFGTAHVGLAQAIWTTLPNTNPCESPQSVRVCRLSLSISPNAEIAPHLAMATLGIQTPGTPMTWTQPGRLPPEGWGDPLPLALDVGMGQRDALLNIALHVPGAAQDPAPITLRYDGCPADPAPSDAGIGADDAGTGAGCSTAPDAGRAASGNVFAWVGACVTLMLLTRRFGRGR